MKKILSSVMAFGQLAACNSTEEKVAPTNANMNIYDMQLVVNKVQGVDSAWTFTTDTIMVQRELRFDSVMNSYVPTVPLVLDTTIKPLSN